MICNHIKLCKMTQNDIKSINEFFSNVILERGESMIITLSLRHNIATASRRNCGGYTVLGELRWLYCAMGLRWLYCAEASKLCVMRSCVLFHFFVHACAATKTVPMTPAVTPKPCDSNLWLPIFSEHCREHWYQ